MDGNKTGISDEELMAALERRRLMEKLPIWSLVRSDSPQAGQIREENA